LFRRTLKLTDGAYRQPSEAGEEDRFARFLDYVETRAAERGGGEADLFPTAVRLLDSAAEGLNRARGIVSDLSAFSRPGAEEPGPMDLNRSVERALTLLGPQLRERGIRIEKRLELDVPVRGVTARVEQVFLNLVQNAIQASPDEATIAVRTRREGDAGTFEVEDHGSGIRPDDRGRVFDPFFTTKPVGEGTGLGLSICYRIVEDLSGEISFRSREGEGTVFTVRLPLAPGGGEDAS